jgi:hypothetical protein
VTLTAQREGVSGRFSYVNEWMKATLSNFVADARDRVLDDSAYNVMVRGMYESAFIGPREHRFKRRGNLLGGTFDYNHRGELGRSRIGGQNVLRKCSDAGNVDVYITTRSQDLEYRMLLYIVT